jgi:hypothetical protein
MFKGENGHSERRKTIPGTRHHHQPSVEASSTRAVAKKRTLRVGVFVPIGADHIAKDLPSHAFYLRHPNQPSTPGTFHYPLVDDPLTETSPEGFGGGTSDKSLAKAKRILNKHRKRR